MSSSELSCQLKRLHFLMGRSINGSCGKGIYLLLCSNARATMKDPLCGVRSFNQLEPHCQSNTALSFTFGYIQKHNPCLPNMYCIPGTITTSTCHTHTVLTYLVPHMCSVSKDKTIIVACVTNGTLFVYFV